MPAKMATGIAIETMGPTMFINFSILQNLDWLMNESFCHYWYNQIHARKEVVGILYLRRKDRFNMYKKWKFPSGFWKRIVP